VVTIQWSKLKLCSSYQQQGFSNHFAGMSLNGIQQFQYTTNMFLYFNKKFGSSDESHNVASNAAYYQIYVAYVSFTF
jgi:hypothetical protein